jgi:probable HAF family extracellular repeat protein
MRSSSVMTAIVFAATVIFVISAPPSKAQQTGDPLPRYYVFNLGDPSGGNNAAAASINNIGWIAGDSYEAGNANEHAFLWVGTPVDLGTLGGANSAVAWPNKNNHGQIAGISETAEMNPLNEQWSCAEANFYPFITRHVCLGFRWEAGVMSPLTPFPGGIDSYAAGINDQGEIVGWAENGVHDPTCNSAPPVNQVLQFEGTVWGPKSGEMTRLSPLGSDPDSAATAINDRGQIVGISGLCANAAGSTSAEHAVLWQNKNAAPIDIGNFDGGLAWNTPTAINERGQVAGFANQAGTPATAFNPIAFFWSRGRGIQPVLPIGDDTNNWAWGINDDGVIVGQSFGGADDPFGRAFVYRNGQATDLNTLIQANSSLQLALANDINDEGEIAGFAIDTTTGAVVAFLAVPVYGGSQAHAGVALPARTVNENLHRSFTGTFGHFAVEAGGSK